MLEVIDKGSVTESHPAPLLFVHGAWHAAWCWDEHFLDFFADRGFRAVAVSLRGHGASTSVQASELVFSSPTMSTMYARQSTARFRDPVLIGHSMGCLVVHKYLETVPAPAAVLMAPSTRGEHDEPPCTCSAVTHGSSCVAAPSGTQPICQYPGLMP